MVNGLQLAYAVMVDIIAVLPTYTSLTGKKNVLLQFTIVVEQCLFLSVCCQKSE